MAETKVLRKWEECNFKWEDNTFTWDDIFFLVELAQLIRNAGDAEQVTGTLSNEKKKRLIKLIAHVKGEEFNESKYKNENIKINVQDVNLVLKEILNIEIKLQ